MWTQTIVRNVFSYDIFVGRAMFYPLRMTLDWWEELQINDFDGKLDINVTFYLKWDLFETKQEIQ
jgi:hypothetical protein